VRNAGKEGHKAFIIGRRERVEDARKPKAKGMVGAMTKEFSMSGLKVATCVGPISPCLEWG
jgi:hypothetical protein